MNLEQRLAAVEAELAEMKVQRKTAEEVSNLMRKVCVGTINNAQRPGGALYQNIAGKKSAEWGVKINPANGKLFGFS